MSDIRRDNAYSLTLAGQLAMAFSQQEVIAASPSFIHVGSIITREEHGTIIENVTRLVDDINKAYAVSQEEISHQDLNISISRSAKNKALKNFVCIAFINFSDMQGEDTGAYLKCTLLNLCSLLTDLRAKAVNLNDYGEVLYLSPMENAGFMRIFIMNQYGFDERAANLHRLS
ncbi:hypothetical protein GC177_03025 [bacterium]|nr:hypothetical protein [bacterium]